MGGRTRYLERLCDPFSYTYFLSPLKIIFAFHFSRFVLFRRKRSSKDLALCAIAKFILAQVRCSVRYEIRSPTGSCQNEFFHLPHLEAGFSAPVQTDPGAHPASYILGTVHFPGIKRPGCEVDHLPPSSAKVKERVQIYLFPHWGFMDCSTVNLCII